MALVRTTLASAAAAGDTVITITLATGFAANYDLRVNGEVMRVASTYVSGVTVPVRRGQNGTAVVAHAIMSGVVCGTDADWSNPYAQTVADFLMAGRARGVVSYGASGAIALPTAGIDMVAILNYTAALTMTLANPTKDLDGSILWIASDGRAQHTVTNASGLGGASTGYTVLTFNGSGTAIVSLMAVNSLWVSIGNVSGTLTNVRTTVA